MPPFTPLRRWFSCAIVIGIATTLCAAPDQQDNETTIQVQIENGIVKATKNGKPIELEELTDLAQVIVEKLGDETEVKVDVFAERIEGDQHGRYPPPRSDFRRPGHHTRKTPKHGRPQGDASFYFQAAPWQTAGPLAIQMPKLGQNGGKLSLPPVKATHRLGIAVGKNTGISVADVGEDSAAEAAGIQVGDLILAVNGDDLVSTDDLIQRIDNAGANKESVTLRILRNDQVLELSASPRKIETAGSSDAQQQAIDQLKEEIAELREMIHELKASHSAE